MEGVQLRRRRLICRGYLRLLGWATERAGETRTGTSVYVWKTTERHSSNVVACPAHRVATTQIEQSTVHTLLLENIEVHKESSNPTISAVGTRRSFFPTRTFPGIPVPVPGRQLKNHQGRKTGTRSLSVLPDGCGYAYDVWKAGAPSSRGEVFKNDVMGN